MVGKMFIKLNNQFPTTVAHLVRYYLKMTKMIISYSGAANLLTVSCDIPTTNDPLVLVTTSTVHHTMRMSHPHHQY